MSVRVAVIDSLAPDGSDRLGHGAAVAATIRRWAPAAEIVPVQIFTDRLLCGIEALTGAIEWCARERVSIANLSIGTMNSMHAEALDRAVREARESGVTLVAAYGWLPGDLNGVIAVDVDPALSGPGFRTREVRGKRILVCSDESAARQRGLSFAVANGTGLLAGGLISGIRETLK